MITEVTINRPLFDCQIRQKSKSEFFSANDLLNAGNAWRKNNGLAEFKLQEWLRTKGVIEFIEELEKKYGQVKIVTRGRNSETWLHPLLFIDLALAMSPKLKIEVYDWILDHLVKYRNDSGDSYKKMCGALYENCNNKSTFHRGVIKTAQMIQDACGVSDWNSTTEDKLKLRDKIHDNISLLCNVLRDNNQAIKIGIIQALENK